MEFWEGAVLIIGGVWLVGRMHRVQTRAVAMSAPVSMPSQPVAGPSSETNMDGSGYLVGGETLHTGTGPQVSSSCPGGCTGGLSQIINNPAFQQYVVKPQYQKPLAVQF